MSDDNPIVGHTTFANPDGSYRHEPLRKAEGDAILAAIEAADADRAKRMPDEQSALRTIFDGWRRLKELGWREAIYCPKDGTAFEAIEAGSTGIFRCQYSGKWPTGGWWIEDGGDLWPASPILFRLYPEDEAKRLEKMRLAAEAFRQERRDA